MSSPSFLEIIEHDRAISYANMSAMALLIYDFFQTLDVEIDYIRHSSRTVIKWSYLCMRCLPFIFVTILVIDDHSVALSDKACLGLKITYWGLALVTFGASELILTIRTWILWGKQRWVATMLITLNFAIYAAGLVIMSLTFASATFVDIDIPEQYLAGCALISSFNKLWVNWTLLAIYDSALCTLLVVRAYNEVKAKRISPSIMRIYREAIIYYLFIFVLDLPGLVPMVIFQDELLPTMSPQSLIVRQLLTARIVLYSWKRAHSPGDGEHHAYALTTLDI